MPPSSPFLPTVQALRALAALMVVLYHVESGINGWFAPRVALPSATAGAAGVDLFFLISGFIMVVTSRGLSAGEFMTRRLIRIVPLYWLSTFVFLAAAFVLPQREGQDHSIAATLTSLLFIPYARPDGAIQPLNPVGWTLNYEMFFYVLFALGLSFARNAMVRVVGTALVAIVLLGALVRPDLPAAATLLRFWADPIVLEFLAGMAVARLYLSGFRIGAPAASLLALLAFATFILAAMSAEPHGFGRLVLWGGPALLLLLAAVLGPDLPLPRPVILLGDASYSLYLFHLPILLVFKQLGPRLALPWQDAATPWLVGLAITGAAILVALVAYLWFERPVTRLLRRWFAAADASKRMPAGAA